MNMKGILNHIKDVNVVQVILLKWVFMLKIEERAKTQ